MTTNVIEVSFVAVCYALAFGVVLRSTYAMPSHTVALLVVIMTIFGDGWSVLRNFGQESHITSLGRIATWTLSCAMIFIGTTIGASIDRRTMLSARILAVVIGIGQIIKRIVLWAMQRR